MAVLARNSGAFAVATLLVLLGIDVAMSTLVAPPPPAPHRQSILLAHALFHVAALLLSFVGATIGFACVRRRLPTRRQSALLGFGFGLVSLLGGAAISVVEGPLLAGSWLIFGSMAFAIGGALLSKPWRTEGHT